MNKSSFRRFGLLLVLAAFSVLGIVRATPAAGERPNLIVIIADDMGAEDAGACGNPNVRTPNIDRLAREGLRCDRAILTTSSCSPSRASILTGRYPHSTGAPELHMPLPANQTLVASALRQAGYWTGAAGKWHLGPAVKSQFDLVQEGGGPSGAENWVPLLRQRPRDRPFFAWLAAVDPHRPYGAGAVEPPHDPGGIAPPPYLPDTDEVRRDLAAYYDEIARLDGFVGRVLDELERQQAASSTLVLFMSDNGRPFPRCKTTLYDSGIRTPFILRWPGKIRASSVSESLVSSIDIAPTLVELAGAKAPASFQGKSFAPLLADPTARVRSFAFSEHNWHDYRAYERGVRSSRYTYIRNWLPELTASPPADAVRSPTYEQMWKMHEMGALPPEMSGCFVVPGADEELYDTQTDPHSIHNLAGDVKYREVLAAHRAALDRWREETGDAFDRDRLAPDRFHRRTGLPLPRAPGAGVQ